MEVAPLLLGWHLTHAGVTLRIVETEAYLATEDQASHARSGPTPRSGVMFGPGGRAYIYRSYGVHFCLNVVCHAPETGGAVLIRAGEVVGGRKLAQARRRRTKGLADGPGKLAQCLDLTLDLNGCCLRSGPIFLKRAEKLEDTAIHSGPRVGISQNTDAPWRFWLAGNPHVSGRRNRV